MTNLEKLETLTENLNIYHLFQRVSIIDTDNTHHPGVMYGLFNDVQVAVSLIKVEAGAHFPAHAHVEYEIVVIYEGILQVKCPIDADWKTYRAPSVAIFNNECAHEAQARTDVSIIAISIPAIAGWPEGGMSDVTK